MKSVLACLAFLACGGEVLAGCPLPRRVYYPPYPVSYGPSYTAAVSYQPVQVAAVAELVTPSVTTVTQFVPVQVAASSAGFAPAAVQPAGVAAAVGVTGGAAQAPAAQPAAAAQPSNADLLKAITGINDSLKNTDGRLQRLEAKVFGEPEVVAPPPEPKAKPATMPPAVDPKEGQSALQLRGRQVVTARCAACHDAATAARKGDGFVLTQEQYPLLLAADKAAKVVRKVRAGEMPPAHPLSDEEKVAVAANYQ